MIEGYEEGMEQYQYLPGVPVTSYVYDAAENPIAFTTPETDTSTDGNTTYYAYDVLNQLIRETLPDPGDSPHASPNYYSQHIPIIW